jgi:hypothetical protein
MSKHDDLLDQGPHEAPEPETAEQRSKRTGWGAAGGGVLGGGIAVAKMGVLTKLFFWLFAWRAAALWGWAGLALVVAAVAGTAVLRSRRHD